MRNTSAPKYLHVNKNAEGVGLGWGLFFQLALNHLPPPQPSPGVPGEGGKKARVNCIRTQPSGVVFLLIQVDPASD
jgi:hypothetical protein